MTSPLGQTLLRPQAQREQEMPFPPQPGVRVSPFLCGDLLCLGRVTGGCSSTPSGRWDECRRAAVHRLHAGPWCTEDVEGQPPASGAAPVCPEDAQSGSQWPCICCTPGGVLRKGRICIGGGHKYSFLVKEASCLQRWSLALHPPQTSCPTTCPPLLAAALTRGESETNCMFPQLPSTSHRWKWSLPGPSPSPPVTLVKSGTLHSAKPGSPLPRLVAVEGSF